MKYITSQPNQGGGLGHQFGNWNCGFTIAKKYNLKFVHRPFNFWDNFLNFGANELRYNEKVFKKIINVELLNFDLESEWLKLENIINQAEDETLIHLATDQNIRDFTTTLEILKQKYWNVPRKPKINDDIIRINVHVRRGDIMKLTQEEINYRLLPNSYFINIINNITSDINQKYEVNIFSQGSLSEFSEFKNTNLYINTDQYETFHSLVCSDILIQSRSGFSFLAGLLTNGTVIAPINFWQKPKTEWLIANKNGEIENT